MKYSSTCSLTVVPVIWVPPQTMARNEGFDFIAITDHNNYNGSIHLLEALKDRTQNMVFIRGEEVHASGCPVHILSLGADKAIAPLVMEINDAQKQILIGLAGEYADKLNENVDFRAFVSAMDVFNKIHDAGGLSVLCHIYWNAVDTTRHSWNVAFSVKITQSFLLMNVVKLE